MLLSGISSRGSGVKSMTVANQDRRARKLVLFLLPATVVFAAGCGSPKAASPLPSPEVEVASVVQKDVPIYSEWVATLDGYVNAQIQPQVAGYVIRQTYKEGSFVRKGQILFQIDPRPFQALLDQVNAQLGTSSSTAWQNRNGCEPGHSTGQGTGDCAEPIGQRRTGAASGKGCGQGSRSASRASPAEPGIHGRQIVGRRDRGHRAGADRKSRQSYGGFDDGFAGESDQGVFLNQRTGVHPFRRQDQYRNAKGNSVEWPAI